MRGNRIAVTVHSFCT